MEQECKVLSCKEQIQDQASKIQDASEENENSHTGALITAQTRLRTKQDQSRSDSNATL